jgi:RHS repeat-associated protein
VTIFVYDASGKLVAEYETNAPQTGGKVQYTTQDTLGSPRVLTNEKGEVTSRRDFLPFGEEITNLSGRTTDYKYGQADNVKQKFTGQLRDVESDLDYFGARYYSNALGRFTSVDPLMASMNNDNPQTFNRYTYVLNNPLRYVDPDGMEEKSAWDQLTKDEQDLIAKKLVLQMVGSGKNARTETPKEAFNRLLKASGLDGANAAENVVAAFRNLLDVTGARNDGAIWNEIKSIDYLQTGEGTKESPKESIGFMMTVNNDRQFLDALKSKGYVVNMRVAGIDETDLQGDHRWSARYQTNRPYLVVPHFVQQNDYASNRFDLHFDPANSACVKCTYTEQLRAAEMHNEMHLKATDTRKFLQEQKTKTRLNITTP